MRPSCRRAAEDATTLRVAVTFVLTLLVLQGTPAEAQYEGDQCTLLNGAAGACRGLRNCPAAQEGLRRGQNPKICGYQGTMPVVCCAQAPATLQQVPARPPAPTRPPPTPARPPPAAPAATHGGGAPNRVPTPRPGQVTRPPPLPVRQPAGPASAVTLNADSKSAEMCRVYARSVFQLVRPPTLTDDDDGYVNQTTCAIRETPLVVGGEPAKLNEFPHMALLGFGDVKKPAFYCGGSLISALFVLTAAHCLSSREEGPVSMVRLGELVISDTNDGALTQDILVAQRIAHPDYLPPARYNDLALLRLQQAAVFTASVRPACIHCSVLLPDTSRDIKLVATGWGRVGFDDETSDKLLKVSLSLIPHATCNRTYRTEASTSKLRRGIDDSTMMCAGEESGGKDTCQGDSGGPLQFVLVSPYCMYCVAGVTSFGKFCGYSNSPAVYTRVAHYRDWIESIVWP